MAKWLLLSGMLLITTDIHSHKKKIYIFLYIIQDVQVNLCTSYLII